MERSKNSRTVTLVSCGILIQLGVQWTLSEDTARHMHP